jgi:formylglycine-generating enzyme required for sulfatase activity
MVEVKGEFCPDVIQECLRWIDKEHKNRHGVIDPNMCEKFRYPSRCVSSQKVPMHFCMDRYEWPNVPGAIPETQMSWVEAKSNCEAAGKRLCAEPEWTFACEGPSMKPYPYGDGYHRDSEACNADQYPWVDPWASSFEEVDHRTPSGAHPRCRSDFGVYDIVGNVDEWVVNPRGHTNRSPWISGLMGGHWVHGIHDRCRYMTDSHEPTFSFYVTGARCCADAD